MEDGEFASPMPRRGGCSSNTWGSERRPIQGKSNPEIGIILGTASRTVQKHLEHIFAKLRVESRTAAARTALETLGWGENFAFSDDDQPAT
jgi:hypothetical protein